MKNENKKTTHFIDGSKKGVRCVSRTPVHLGVFKKEFFAKSVNNLHLLTNVIKKSSIVDATEVL